MLDVATSVSPHWLDPTEAPPPTGTKLLLLTTWGIAVIGTWPKDGKGYVAWSPLPRIPKQIKEKLCNPVS
jgi:hypothetical protein